MKAAHIKHPLPQSLTSACGRSRPGQRLLRGRVPDRGALGPARVFKSRPLIGGNAVMLLIGMAAWGVGLATSTYAQRVLGYSALL